MIWPAWLSQRPVILGGMSSDEDSAEDDCDEPVKELPDEDDLVSFATTFLRVEMEFP